jgi:type I restriction enzyme S subunit
MITEVGKISTQIRGISYSQGDAIHSTQEDYAPILRANNITEDGLNFKDLIYVPKRIIKEHQLLKKGDILIAASSGSKCIVGKAALVKSDIFCSFGAFCKVIRPNRNVDFGYFSYFFQTPDYRKKISALSTGANINNLKNEHLDKLRIPLPPLETQKKIAAILYKADELRRNNLKILEKYDQLAQSVFLEMFGDPLRNEREWNYSELRFLGKIITGSTPSSSKLNMFGGNIPFVTPGDLDSNKPYQRFVTKEGAENSRTITAGALFVCCIGATIGKVRMAKERCAFNQQINAIQWDTLIDPYYGLHAFRFVRKEVINKAISTTLPILKKSEFEKIKMAVPPTKLQIQFGEIVNQIDVQRKLTVQSLQKSEDLFQSLLQRAFKGELV